jgi:tRNA (guanosine-2'-O-)-methyltransferase
MKSYQDALIAHLSGFVSPKRLELFHRVLGDRTRYLSVLLEDIYQSQNASAVLRTCDCVGIQDVHIVEEGNQYEVNPDVSLGSNQWLNMHYYNEGMEIKPELHRRKPGLGGGKSILKAIHSLKAKGYRMVATSPHKDGSTPEDFNLERGKAVMMFGTELNGLTDQALELADEYIRIPMVGFTESFNISVSAALVLYSLRKRLEASQLDWRIGEAEKGPIMLQWLRNTIKMSAQIERKFEQEYG